MVGGFGSESRYSEVSLPGIMPSGGGGDKSRYYLGGYIPNTSFGLLIGFLNGPEFGRCLDRAAILCDNAGYLADLVRV